MFGGYKLINESPAVEDVSKVFADACERRGWFDYHRIHLICLSPTREIKAETERRLKGTDHDERLTLCFASREDFEFLRDMPWIVP